MTQAVKDLFSSKKFLTALIGLVVALGAKFGLNLDSTLVASIVGLFATAIVGQGLQDHGSTAASIHADAAKDAPPPAPAVVNAVEVKS